MILDRLKAALAIEWQRTLYIMFFAQLMTSVGFSSIFPFLPLYVKALGTNTNMSIELLAGLVFSGQAITMMIASPIWGSLADRFGRKLMVERALFGGTIILLLMAFARSAEELVLLRVVQGVVTGTVGASNALVAAVAPRERTGYAMGLLQVGLGSGVAIGPLIGGAIADSFGYGAAFFVTSSLLFIAGIMVLFGVKETKTNVGLQEDEPAGYIAKWWQILCAPGVMITYSIRFLSRLGQMMIIPVAPLFIETLLPNTDRLNTFTGLVIATTFATTTISSIYFGRLGDRIGHRHIIIASLFIASILYLPQSLVTSGWQLLTLQALIGIALGGIIPAIGALLANYTRSGVEGAVYGLDNSITSGARGVAPLLGAGVALWFGLRATFVATAFIFLITGVLALWRLPEPKETSQVHGE